MSKVYILSYEIVRFNAFEHEMISQGNMGVYSSLEAAERAQSEYEKLPEKSKWEYTSYQIDCYEVKE